jgi:perosamine synthetase
MSAPLAIPFHRPDIGEDEIAAVARVLRSGWLTTGVECQCFEAELAAFVGARHALAVNSCTAALHLALDAIGLRRGDRVLVPTMTFAATAEVVTYFDATPVLIDCDPVTLNLDVAAAERYLARGGDGPVRAILLVHYGGQMGDVDAVAALARRYRLHVIEDAAHALPAAARGGDGIWRSVGVTAEQTCFSFYANKTITTGEGGMLVSDDATLIERARSMSLHGLSAGAWQRYRASGEWSYDIEHPGFKYNLTDIAAAIGRVQLRKAEGLCQRRARLAQRYTELLRDVDELELPVELPDRRSAWHLYPIRLNLPLLSCDRDQFLLALAAAHVGASVHWKPLHLHPYYRQRFGLRPGDLPVATREWQRLISLPLFPSLSEAEQATVVAAVRDLCRRHGRRVVA